VTCHDREIQRAPSYLILRRRQSSHRHFCTERNALPAPLEKPTASRNIAPSITRGNMGGDGVFKNNECGHALNIGVPHMAAYSPC
jgi:hypothetical protein